jgi:hypothetical protein
MRILTLLSVLLFAAGSAVAQTAAKPSAADTEAIVQQQLEAYNAHDIKAFLATYDKDAEIIEYPSKVLMKGWPQIEAFYAKSRFNDPILHATITRRIALGAFVVDHEQVRRTLADGPGVSEVIAMYEVQDGKIVRVTLMRATAPLARPAS